MSKCLSCEFDVAMTPPGEPVPEVREGFVIGISLNFEANASFCVPCSKFEVHAFETPEGDSIWNDGMLISPATKAGVNFAANRHKYL